MRNQNCDAFDIRQLVCFIIYFIVVCNKQESVLSQTKSMIEIVKKDIEKANEEITQLIEDLGEDEDIKLSEVYKQAVDYVASL